MITSSQMKYDPLFFSLTPFLTSPSTLVPRRALGHEGGGRGVDRHGGAASAEGGGHRRGQLVPHPDEAGRRGLQRPLRCGGEPDLYASSITTSFIPMYAEALMQRLSGCSLSWILSVSLIYFRAACFYIIC